MNISDIENPKEPLSTKLNRLWRGFRQQNKTIRASFLFICFWSISYTGWFFPEVTILKNAIMAIATILILFHLTEIFVFTRVGYFSALLEDANEEFRAAEEEINAARNILKDQRKDWGEDLS